MILALLVALPLGAQKFPDQWYGWGGKSIGANVVEFTPSETVCRYDQRKYDKVDLATQCAIGTTVLQPSTARVVTLSNGHFVAVVDSFALPTKVGETVTRTITIPADTWWAVELPAKGVSAYNVRINGVATGHYGYWMYGGYGAPDSTAAQNTLRCSDDRDTYPQVPPCGDIVCGGSYIINGQLVPYSPPCQP